MTTTSTANLYRQIGVRLLTFAPMGSPTPATLANQLTGGLHVDQAPDNVPVPYATMRFLPSFTDTAHRGERMRLALEINVYHRPRLRASIAEDLADLVQSALLRWHDSSSGLVFAQGCERATIPPLPAPADRELVHVRLVCQLVAWPLFLTQYAAT